ncbi:hypothetical protein D9M73_225900 [compost metagenome]
MAVFFDLHGLRPLLFHGITQAVQRAYTGVTAPGENQFAGATGTDQLIVDQVRSHTYQGQLFLALTNDFMPGGSRNQVREAFEGDTVTVMDKLLHGIVEREDFSHCRLLDMLSRGRLHGALGGAGRTSD